MTMFGIAALCLALLGLYSSLRLGGQCDEAFMEAWRAKQIEERYLRNPKLRRR